MLWTWGLGQNLPPGPDTQWVTGSPDAGGQAVMWGLVGPRPASSQEYKTYQVPVCAADSTLGPSCSGPSKCFRLVESSRGGIQVQDSVLVRDDIP